MDLRLRLRVVLDRVQLSARELEIQPEMFQGTAELRLAAGDLAAILEALDRQATHAGLPAIVAGMPHKCSTNRGTGLALAPRGPLAA